MSTYPYDKEKMVGGSSNVVLKQMFGLSFEIMQLYEPFGQAASTYEDTGYPEYVALGLRTFLSVPENIGMLRDIGKSAFKSLVTMGHVYTTQGTDEEKTEWKRLMVEMKKADRRTYEAIDKEMKKEMEKCHKE